MKTVAQIAKEVLIETKNDMVGWGDCSLLDEIASRCTHTKLMQMHPLERHIALLNRLEGSSLFKKWKYKTVYGYGNRERYVRNFELI